MRILDRLSDDEVLALGKFIVACAQTGSSSRWRTRFADCAARERFSPPAHSGEEQTLKSICARHGRTIVCVLRTTDVMVAANQVSLAYGKGPLEFPSVNRASGIAGPEVSGGHSPA
jgi:hypothetical protein